MIDRYEELANAIVLEAVKDYRKALKRLELYPFDRAFLYTKKEVEKFFLSEWYGILTTVDPNMLIEQLNQEVLR